MNGKELFYFTGKCLTLEEHPEFGSELIRENADESIDWERFTGICSNHLILPIIYLKFKANGLLPILPEVVADFWEEIYLLNLSRNEMIIEQLDEIISLLNQNDIYPTILKGAGNLLEGLYSDKGERMIGDIDLLVPEKEYLRTAKILENDGYRSDGKIYGEVGNLKHYPRLFKPGSGVNIEIHRLVVAPPHSKWFSTDMIDREKISVTAKTSYYLLSDQHKVIYNFIHCQLGHSGDAYGIVAFRDLYDLYLLSKRVDVSTTIGQIKAKRKAMSYFAFAGSALGLPQWFYPIETIPSKLFHLKHDLNHLSTVFYYTNRNLHYFYKRVLIGFPVQIIQSLYSRSMRQSVISRLGNPHWYKDHFHSYFSQDTAR
jgi:hypothetical protein